jgi:putative membrane protein
MDPVQLTPAWLKAAHLVATVFFFAGTIHIVRLFVAHRAALARWEPDRTILTDEFGAMERRALFWLNWPALMVALLLGGWMLVRAPGLLKLPFVQVGMGMYAAVVGYHFSVHRIYVHLQQGTLRWPAFKLQLWSQGASMLLLALILLALMRDRLTWTWGVLGLMVVGGIVMYVIGASRKTEATEHADTGNESA